MRKNSKVLKRLIAADFILIVLLFMLCVIADSKDVDNSLQEGSLKKTSLTMDNMADRAVTKGSVFDKGIYDREVIPSGEAVGIYMKTDGVLVVDICSFTNKDGINCCPSKGKLEMGDYITDVNKKSVTKRSELLKLVQDSKGETLSIGYVRNGKKYDITLTPEKNQNGDYLIGAWVKDDVSGIGTVTFVDGYNFMALGHSVSDMDTGLMMKCSVGGIFRADISSIYKSHVDEPGRLQGSIAYKRSLIGIVEGNSISGIYGYLDSNYYNDVYGNEESMPIAKKEEAKAGKAYIYSRLTGELKKYLIEIESVDLSGVEKNLEFKVVDDSLIGLTGGVVQGMSGSPIVQNGKLIGAVTHVLVDDPTRGYGILLENMLEQ